jgi:tetratricopeptide (TPR) repeat protein
LKQSIEIEKDNSLYNILKDYFDASMDMIKAEKIGAEELVADYTVSTDILKQSTDKYKEYIVKEKKKSAPNQKKIQNWEKIISNNDKVNDYVTKKFASSDYSKCEYLIPAFKGNFDKRKGEKEWLKTVTGILSFKECTDDPFYGEAAEALYNLDPSADAAFKLALFYLKKENYPEAAKYFEEAYTQEEDDETKAEYYYYAAVVSFAQNKFSGARSLAMKAAELKSDYGKPYVLIAKLYAASAGNCGEDKFEKSAVYWAAVDKLVRAKSVDKSVEDEANQLINRYSSRYPNSEEGFMRGIYKGDSYKVGCWIQENTTARY